MLSIVYHNHPQLLFLLKTHSFSTFIFFLKKNNWEKINIQNKYNRKMPAEFTVYLKLSDTKTTPTILYENADKSYRVFKRVYQLYKTDSLENEIIVGTRTIIYTSIINNDYIITTITVYNRFNEYSGVPYGDENILVLNSTRYNKVINNIVIDGIYRDIVNPSQSTGEYANQVGYEIYVKDSTKTFGSFTFYFPLPILTYTNAFNSLPQPSTAPLPA
jgi:hypothetical protein